ncbi:MAG: sel1 repeat family protein [Verrucomicrobia bacterium]|nr:sel1 repeat family protein [Verrucomicrobiota bacterium]
MLVLERLLLFGTTELNKVGELASFLQGTHAKSNVDRILLAVQVLRECFSPVYVISDVGRFLFRMDAGLEPAPSLRFEKPSMEFLGEMHQHALADWMFQHDLQAARVLSEPKELSDCLKTAVRGGDVKAGYLLAISYSDGFGVDKDGGEAYRLMVTAAEGGDSNAQCTLGFMYLCGELVQSDTTQGEFWLRQASKRGNRFASAALASGFLPGAGRD